MRQNKQNSLFLSLIRQHKRTVLGGAVIRLCLSAFTFSQPFLVKALLEYVRKGSSGTSAEGMWLIIAYAAVYTGIAVSTLVPLSIPCVPPVTGADFNMMQI